MVNGRIAAAPSLLLSGAAGVPQPSGERDAAAREDFIRLAQSRRTCKQVSSCEEAVILWCSGYTRADGDGDGIPCENVCSTKAQVDAIRRQIGC